MTFKLKDLTLLSYRSFNGSWNRFETALDHEKAILKRFFDDTKSGIIKGFYKIDDKHFYAVHRSPQKPGFIQLSCGFYKAGDLVPTYDVQCANISDLLREGLPSGRYATID